MITHQRSAILGFALASSMLLISACDSSNTDQANQVVDSPPSSAIATQAPAETSPPNTAPIVAEAPQISADLVGTWRKTTIQFEQPVDNFLKLNSDGSGSEWRGTASGQEPPVSLTWSVNGNTVLLNSGGQSLEFPFTFYEGQLVLPNIEGNREFWDKIG